MSLLLVPACLPPPPALCLSVCPLQLSPPTLALNVPRDLSSEAMWARCQSSKPLSKMIGDFGNDMEGSMGPWCLTGCSQLVLYQGVQFRIGCMDPTHLLPVITELFLLHVEKKKKIKGLWGREKEWAFCRVIFLLWCNIINTSDPSTSLAWDCFILDTDSPVYESWLMLIRVSIIVGTHCTVGTVMVL